MHLFSDSMLPPYVERRSSRMLLVIAIGLTMISLFS